MEKFGIQGQQSAMSFGALASDRTPQPAATTMRELRRSWLAPITVAAAYYLTAKLGEWLAFPSAPVSALWAPNAIVMAALVLAPRARWWTYLLAVLPFHLLAQLPNFPLSQVLIQYLLNNAEALIGALAIKKLCPGLRRFDRVRSALVLIIFGGIVAPIVTSVLMAGAFVAVGLSREFWLTSTVRTLSNTFAVVTLVPLIVHGVERLRAGQGQVVLARAAEACVLAICLVGIGFLVFVLPAAGPHRSPILLPILVWAVMRFGVAGACGAALLVGALSTWGVLSGQGPFTTQDPVEAAFSVISFQAATSIALVIFAALLEERTQAGRALSASEAKFRGIFEHNIIPTVIWRDDFHISDANDAFVRLTGFSHADIERGGLPFDQLSAWSRQSDALQSSSATEKELVVRDGRRIPVIVSGHRFPGEPGGVIYALDLSEFRRAEAGRLTAEGLHSAVLASVHDQIAVLDSAGTIVEINDSWRRFVRTARARRFDFVLEGENFLTACAQAAERGDRAAAEQLGAVRAVLDQSETRRQLEFAGASSAGQYWFEVSIEQLRRPEGGAVITRTDVTPRKQAELEALNQRQQLAHLGRAAVLGQLSGAFAHELNQPLTSILGNAEAALRLLASDGSDPLEIREILRDIVEEDERAAQIIQRLRSLLRKGDIQRQPVDLNAIVHEVLDLARTELITRNVSVSTDFDAQAPFVMADRVQMQQVVLNLLMNACEAMTGVPPPDRKVALATRSMPQTACVEMTIHDSGCGIATGDTERIFQAFVTTKAHGLGLGLAICRSVAEAHHGRLWAEENAGHGGAIFHLSVPVEGGVQ